ncbi:hypothetical protein H4R18_005475 [Coemansia javaensis]|uniref:Uncharacterized protein n=1 Tax=Coemansia javaensis TaxID=2761396 RepID=A0A9W8H7K6_9FUNG|nr:hypothetical protein H4R18_005475 [Coemansia javaensis]
MVQVAVALLALAAAGAGANRAGPPVHRRQMYDGPAGVEGMGERYRSPFAAFWNQGLVPGQGFPQVGMSAYGYGLPGLGLGQFVSPDAQILAGAGSGEISSHDLDRLDDKINGYDRFKEGTHRAPDPAYPGCFKSEDCDHGYHHAAAPRASHSHAALVGAIAAALLL